MSITLPSFHISETFITLIFVEGCTCKNVAFHSSQLQTQADGFKEIPNLNLNFVSKFEFELLFFRSFGYIKVGYVF